MIRLDADKRAVRDALQREIRLIEKPAKDVSKKKARQDRRERVKAIGKPAEGQREPRVHDKPYLAWVRRQPCAVADQDCNGPVEAAHLRYSDAKQGRINPGMQCKPSDVWCLPLCHHHHQHDQHKRSERAFWASRGIEPADRCRSNRATYEALLHSTDTRDASNGREADGGQPNPILTPKRHQPPGQP